MFTRDLIHSFKYSPSFPLPLLFSFLYILFIICQHVLHLLRLQLPQTNNPNHQKISLLLWPRVTSSPSLKLPTSICSKLPPGWCSALRGVTPPSKTSSGLSSTCVPSTTNQTMNSRYIVKRPQRLRMMWMKRLWRSGRRSGRSWLSVTRRGGAGRGSTRRVRRGGR